MKELDDFIDEFQGKDLDEFLSVDLGGFDSDVDEYDYMNRKMQDISAVEVRKGKDIQGIPWKRVTTTRE
ncbi:hypothetical protein KY289_001569 [Solanum tuberosum]|nr:hypothetical protein KY289_001569 [Solanum tuberosum]